MLARQARNGRISLDGIRAVRQAIVDGDQVDRGDVLAIIRTLIKFTLDHSEAREALSDPSSEAAPGAAQPRP